MQLLTFCVLNAIKGLFTAGNVALNSEGVTDCQLVQLERWCSTACPIRVHHVCVPLPDRESCKSGNELVLSVSVDQTLAVVIICLKKKRKASPVAVNTLPVVFTFTGKGRFLFTDCVVRLRLDICSGGPTKINCNGSDKVICGVCVGKMACLWPALSEKELVCLYHGLCCLLANWLVLQLRSSRAGVAFRCCSLGSFNFRGENGLRFKLLNSQIYFPQQSPQIITNHCSTYQWETFLCINAKSSGSDRTRNKKTSQWSVQDWDGDL